MRFIRGAPSCQGVRVALGVLHLHHHFHSAHLGLSPQFHRLRCICWSPAQQFLGVLMLHPIFPRAAGDASQLHTNAVVAAGSGACRAACRLPGKPCVPGPEGCLGQERQFGDLCSEGSAGQPSSGCLSQYTGGGGCVPGWNVPRASGTLAGRKRAHLGRDRQWSRQRAAPGRTRSHTLLLVPICSSP